MKSIKFLFLIIFLTISTHSPASNLENESSLTNYIKLLKENPGNYQLCNKIGIIYKKTGKNDLAKEYFLRAIYLNNQYYEGYNNLGLWYYENGDYKEAMINFKRAILINPERPESYINLLNTYIKLQDYNSGLSEIENCIEKFSQSYEFLNQAGILYLIKGEYSKSIEYFEKSLKLKKDETVMNNLGVALYLAGKHKEAKKILKTLPKTDKVIENLKLIEK